MEVRAWLDWFVANEFGELEPHDEVRRQFMRFFGVSGRVLLQRSWRDYEQICSHDQVLLMWAAILFDVLHPPALQESDGMSQMLSLSLSLSLSLALSMTVA